MSGGTTTYAALTPALAAPEVGATVALPPDVHLGDDLSRVAPDLTSTGVAVVAHPVGASPGAGTEVTVRGERRMLHHLASAADVEIPVRLLAVGPIRDDEADAILSRTMLAVLVAVS